MSDRVIKKVSERVYLGPRPLSFNELAKLRTSADQRITVINLQSGIFEFFNDDEYEDEDARYHGMLEINFRLSDFFAPSIATLKSIAEAIDFCLIKGDVIYVHCKWGKDRTGMACAAHRILNEKWSPEMAIQEMYDNGFRQFPYFFWVKNLRGLN